MDSVNQSKDSDASQSNAARLQEVLFSTVKLQQQLVVQAESAPKLWHLAKCTECFHLMQETAHSATTFFHTCSSFQFSAHSNRPPIGPWADFWNEFMWS